MRPSLADLSDWGIDPAWSRDVSVPSHDGSNYRWHVLHAGPPSPIGTIVCVHGNPTWSYLWRSFLHRFGDRYRVIAVDQLGMGYSDRTSPRRYATRVKDLDDVLVALDVTGPVILAAHDWGGAIAMGWAVARPERVAALILTNTGIAVPSGTRGPALIRFAAATGITDLACRRTPMFVAGTVALSGQRMRAAARRGYLAPYRRRADRAAIASFVGDVPFSPRHPSAADLASVAARLGSIQAPVLLAWGGRDPVFTDAFADDLAGRFPHVDRHRFGGCGHLVVEEADVASVADTWLSAQAAAGRAPTTTATDPATFDPVAFDPAANPVAATSTPTHFGEPRRPLWAGLHDRAGDTSVAFLNGSDGASVSWADLHKRVEAIACGLVAVGLQPGDRVALAVPPGPDLVALVYGCWRAGVVTVLADKGLGLRGLGRALRSAGPAWIVGPPAALGVARLLRWAPGARAIQVGGPALPKLGGTTLAQLIETGASARDVQPPSPDLLAAVLFTSGATGPAKGVRYLHRQLEAQRDALARTYAITSADRLVAAFAPFALYGPALGIASAIPDVDVTQPGALTAPAFDEACRTLNATIAFASPAALANVVKTSTSTLPAVARLRLVLSAGAPVAASLLASVAKLAPAAEIHTPYGMTEALPVADIGLDELGSSAPGRGVNVGHPVEGASVRIEPLVGTAGRVMVSAPWLSDGYDRLWNTEANARSVVDGVVWHDSGDVGHLDVDGSLWIEGRGVHCITSSCGLLTPVPIENEAEAVAGVRRAAAVGVGPTGVQQLVVIIEPSDGRDESLATAELTAAIRAAVTQPVAAVLTVAALPVDIRHNAKIDRTALAGWAATVLDGHRAKAPR